MLISQTLFFFHEFLDLGIDLQNGPRCPPVLGFSYFGFKHHYISDFYGMLKSFLELFHAPQLCLGIFDH